MNKDFKTVKFEQFIDDIFKTLEESRRKNLLLYGFDFIIKYVPSLPLSGLIYIYNYN